MKAAAPIVSRRLSLDVLDAPSLDAIQSGAPGVEAFAWPPWWPDGVDVPHVALWRRRADGLDGRARWQPRAVVDDEQAMVGHIGFHLPPRSMAEALSDPTYDGPVPETASGVVEIGYRIFVPWQGRGYATEAATALVDWAFADDEVTAIVAAVDVDNTASLAVLDRVGGFERIGSCTDGDGALQAVLCRLSASRR